MLRKLILSAIMTSLLIVTGGAKTVSNDLAHLVAVAKAGDPEAQYRLGVAYENIHGGRFSLAEVARRDVIEAANWYSMAAAQGHVGARYRLGDLYEHGVGVEKNERQAARWYWAAASAGHAGAQKKMGDIYAVHSGFGPRADKSDVEAAKWYRLAADQGDDAAEFELGVLLENGEGVAHDPAGALKLFRSSAARGNSDALALLRIRAESIRVVRP